MMSEAVTPKQIPSSPDSTERANDEVVTPKQTLSSAGSKDSTKRVSGSSTERQTTVSKYLVSPKTETPLELDVYLYEPVLSHWRCWKRRKRKTGGKGETKERKRREKETERGREEKESRRTS